MTPYFRVNGVDFIPFLTDGGLAWEENDIDADGSGRSMDGVMHRSIVSRKDKFSLSFKPLTDLEAKMISAAVSATFVTVETNVHPKRAGNVSLRMYNSSRKAAVMTLDEDGNAKWTYDAISLIER